MIIVRELKEHMTESVIDTEIFQDLQLSAGEDFVRELVDTFLEEAPVLLAQLRAARDEADTDAFRRAAHSLKSNAQTFGAAALAHAARAIEIRGLHADADADQMAIHELECLLGQAAYALRELGHD